LAALHDRANAAQEVVDYRREELGARLGELIGKFDQTANDELQALADSSAAEVASLAGEVQATADGFASAANFENNGINAFLDDLVKQWVWWLKQYYGYGGYAASYYEGYEEAHHGHGDAHYGGHGHDAAHDPAYDQHDPAAYDPHKLAGYDEIEAFFKRDFVGDLPDTKTGLLNHIDEAATEAENMFANIEDAAEAGLEARRSELQTKLVGQREAIEQGLADAQGSAKANIVEARDAFIADVTEKRAAVEGAIQQLQEQHYHDEEHSDKRELLYEIHEAKEAFATAVQDARSQFDLILTTARDQSESRLAAAREQFETDLQRKRADLDATINTMRTDLANQAAAKREALGLALGAAWEDMEEAITEKVAAFDHAVEQKLAWINKVRYYGLRHKLLEAVKELKAVFADDVEGIKQMFADQAEERRLAADAAITATQDEFEVFVASVLATCDSNRGAQSTALETAITDRRTAFDDLLGECRKAISWAIDGQIKELKEFLQNQYGYQGHKPGPYAPKADNAYFDDEYVDAVQTYVDGVTKPMAEQAGAALAWLEQRKTALKDAIIIIEDEIENAQNARVDYEAKTFGEQIDGAIQNNGQLAAQLLADVQAKNDAIQSTLEAVKHQHYGY
jgi:hypothetical protein